MIRSATFVPRSVIIGPLMCFLIAPLAPAQQKQAVTNTANRMELGRLKNGAVVTYVRSGSGGWGIEISGDAVPRLTQPKPAQIEVYRGGDDVRQIAAGYQSVRKEAGVIVAKAMVEGGGGGLICHRRPVEDCGQRVVAQLGRDRDRH